METYKTGTPIKTLRLEGRCYNRPESDLIFVCDDITTKPKRVNTTSKPTGPKKDKASLAKYLSMSEAERLDYNQRRHIKHFVDYEGIKMPLVYACQSAGVYYTLAMRLVREQNKTAQEAFDFLLTRPVYVNDGTTCIRVPLNEVPDGWSFGRLLIRRGELTEYGWHWKKTEQQIQNQISGQQASNLIRGCRKTLLSYNGELMQAKEACRRAGVCYRVLYYQTRQARAGLPLAKCEGVMQRIFDEQVEKKRKLDEYLNSIKVVENNEEVPLIVACEMYGIKPKMLKTRQKYLGNKETIQQSYEMLKLLAIAKWKQKSEKEDEDKKDAAD